MKWTASLPLAAISVNFPSLTVKDAVVLDWFTSFVHTGRMEYKDSGGRLFYWVSYEEIITEIPMLRWTTTDPVYRAFRRMVKAGIFDAHPDNAKENKAFYAFGPGYEKIRAFDPIEFFNAFGRKGTPGQNQEEREGTPGQNNGRPPVKKPGNNNISNISTNIVQNDFGHQSFDLPGIEEEKEEGGPDLFEGVDISFESFWNAYGRKESKKRAKRSWKNLPKYKKKLAIEKVAPYDEFLKANPWRDKMLPTTWISGERWNDDFSTKASGSISVEDLIDVEADAALVRSFKAFRGIVADKAPEVLSCAGQLTLSQYIEVATGRAFPGYKKKMTTAGLKSKILSAVEAMGTIDAYKVRRPDFKMIDYLKDYILFSGKKIYK